MEFKQFVMISELANVRLSHPAHVSGDGMPCPGKIAVGMIDMRFEDYGQSGIFGPFTPFWAKFPGDPLYLVYHGKGDGDVLSAGEAAPYIEKYKQVPSDWWKYAQALNPDYEPVKEPLKTRGDWEKINPQTCNPHAINVMAKVGS